MAYRGGFPGFYHTTTGETREVIEEVNPYGQQRSV